MIGLQYNLGATVTYYDTLKSLIHFYMLFELKFVLANLVNNHTMIIKIQPVFF